MKTNLFKKVIAIGMTAIILIVTPLTVLANEDKTKGYISELCVASNVNADSAKQELTDKGYIVIDKNVNEGTGKEATFIGYKTTTNVEEAITDMRVMDMNGGYSASSYQTMLKEYEEQVTKELEAFKESISDFRELYLDGDKKAIYSYKLLNKLKEDDSGKLIGDLFVEKNLDITTLTKVFIQGNPEAIRLIEQAFALVFSDDFLQDTADNMSNNYSGATYLDEACENIIATWDTLQQGLYDYYTQLSASDGYDMSKYSEDSYESWKATNPSKSDSVYLFGCLYEYLLKYKTNDGKSLIELFLKNKDELSYEELYPLADALSQGTIQSMKYVGLVYSVSINDCDIDELEKIQTENKDEIEKAAIEYANSCATNQKDKVTSNDVGQVVSVYAGVDRTLFDKNSGVALTDDAKRSKARTKDNVGNCILNSKDFTLLTVLTCGNFMAGCVIAGFGIYTFTRVPTALLATSNYFSLYCTLGLASVFVVASIVSVAIMVGKGIKEYYHPTYSLIPRAMIDEVTFKTKNIDGKETTYKNFIAYYAVLDAEDTGKDNRKFGDLNGWGAHQWNALYYTKDSRAGNPITTDFVVQFGNSESPSGYSPLRYFGSNNNAFDLNTHAFSSNTGVYLFYRSYSQSSLIGSLFSYGGLGIAVLSGMLIGGCLVFFITKKKYSMKKVA